MEISIFEKENFENFKNELVAELKSVLGNTTKEQPQYLRSAQVREMLNISDSTLQNLRIKGIIPAFKLGDMWLYRQADIVEAIEGGINKNGGDHE